MVSGDKKGTSYISVKKGQKLDVTVYAEPENLKVSGGNSR